MQALEYSQRLGMITTDQFQAALDRLDLGRLLHAEPIPFGLSKRNVFLTTTKGEYVFRGAPHYPHQFASEHFFAQKLHEQTSVPIPWPYLFDPSNDIFGWSYAIMPRMPGLQLVDPKVKANLSREDRIEIACAMGENLAHMQELTWEFPGQYYAKTDTLQPFEVKYSQRIITRIRDNLARSRQYSDRTTPADADWVEELISLAKNAFDDSFEPCFVMQDYKEDNVVVECLEGLWRISGVFDLTHAHIGDGEADISCAVAQYLDEDPKLACEFVQAYFGTKVPRAGLPSRYPIYMLDNRLRVWEFCQQFDCCWWDKKLMFHEWASRYVSYNAILCL